MTAITFPNSPSSGDTHTAGNGIVYTYDGEKWTSIGTNSAGTWTRSGTEVSLTNAGDDLNVDSGTLFVDASTDRVGVGTTSPGVPLQINTTSSGSQDLLRLINENATANNTAGIQFGPANGVVGAAIYGLAESDFSTTANRDGALTFHTRLNGGGIDERVRIDSSGRLGIGTSSPGSYDSNADNFVVANTTGNAGISIIGSTTGASSLYFGDGTGTSTFRGYIDYLHGTDVFRFGTAANTRAVIDSSGRVGIGTTPNSDSRLHVKSGANDGNPVLRLEAANNNFLNFRQTGSVYDIHVTAGDPLSFSIGSSERARIDSSGRLLVGTSSSASAGDSQFARLQIRGNSYSSSGNGLLSIQAGTATPAANTSVGALLFADNTGGVYSSILGFVDGTAATNDYPGRLVFSTTADGASSPTERMRINQAGDVYLQFQGGSSTRVYMSGSAGAASIGTSSFLAATTTLYIGNAAIQVSSDARLKENIEDTKLDALDAVSKIKVRDFTWNDPTDTSHNNRNARGKWTGLIAQELVEVLPFVVNAPRKEEDGSIDHDSEDRWTLDQSQLCPVLIKAVQQQQEIIASLEARLSALEAS